MWEIINLQNVSNYSFPKMLTIITAPQILGGYVCQHFARGGSLPAFGLNSTKSKRPFVCKTQYFVAKTHKQKDVYQLLRAAKCWQTSLFRNIFFKLFLHISFGLSGPLWTAFELKNSTAYSKKSGACDCANGN